MLFPEQITLSVAEGLALDGIMDELAYLGFEISSLGGASYAVQGIPAGIDGLNPTSLLCDILHSVMECTSDVGEKLYDRLAIAMARQVAIVPGQILTGEEIQALVCNLFNCKMNARTPDGKTIVYVETDTEIARFFSK